MLAFSENFEQNAHLDSMSSEEEAQPILCKNEYVKDNEEKGDVPLKKSRS